MWSNFVCPVGPFSLAQSHMNRISAIHMVTYVRIDYKLFVRSCNGWILQGGDTPIYSVLRSSSSVKIKVKGQPPKIADSQKSNCLLAGQESTSSFT